MRGLTLDEANTIIGGAFREARRLKLRPLSIAVLDAGGHVKASQRQDGCAMLRFEIAQGKAYAALVMGRSSAMVLQKLREKPAFVECLKEMADKPLFLEAGGQLIRDPSGEVVGAVGITGDVGPRDDDCAIAGIHAAGFRADTDFDNPGDPEGMVRVNVKLMEA